MANKWCRSSAYEHLWLQVTDHMKSPTCSTVWTLSLSLSSSLSDLVLKDSYLAASNISLQLEGFFFFFFRVVYVFPNGRVKSTDGTAGSASDKMDGVFISVLIATATLTWRLQKHEKATTRSTCICLSPRIKATRRRFQTSVFFMAWGRKVAYYSGGPNENKKGCMTFKHLEPQQAEKKVMWFNPTTPPNLWMCEFCYFFLTFQRLEEWQLAWWLSGSGLAEEREGDPNNQGGTLQRQQNAGF